MTFTLCVFAATVALMICSVLFKPYIKIGKARLGLYYIITVIGAAVLLFSGELPLDFALDKITAKTAVNPLKILALFLSVSLISLYLGDSGFFDFIAEKVFMKTDKGGVKLFIILFAVVSVLTAFTSNDIVILTFTPPVCIFCKKAKVSPVPYLFGEFVAANVFSMALLIGNPTNVYLAESFGVEFFSYLSVMALPAILAGVVSLAVLLLVFGKTLKRPVALTSTETEEETRAPVKVNNVLMGVSLFHLFACLVLLAAAEFIGIETYLVCVISSLSLTAVYFTYSIIKEKTPRRTVKVFAGAPYELIPFVLSMFVIVLSLSYCSFTEKLSEIFITGKKTDAVSFGFLSAAASNLLNNIPMSVLFEKIIAGKSVSALYGAVIGSNIGAFISPVGALAGIMWSRILSDYKIKFPFWKFFVFGVLTAVPALAAATLSALLFI